MNTIPNAETVRFDNGDMLHISTDRTGMVVIEGSIGGGRALHRLSPAAAIEQGFLLCESAPDALWILEPARSERIGNAMIAVATLAARKTPEAPPAPELPARHVAMVDLTNGQTADVWIREPGMIAIDLTTTGSPVTLSSDPTTTAHLAEGLLAGEDALGPHIPAAARRPLGEALRAALAPPAAAPAAGPGPAADRAGRALCPSWCADHADPDHWTRRRNCSEALHVRRFGPVAVYVLEEVRDDGACYVGTPEAVIRHADHTQQVGGESALTIAEASDLAAHLAEATRFAAREAQRIAASAAQGIITADSGAQGEQVTR